MCLHVHVHTNTYIYAYSGVLRQPIDVLYPDHTYITFHNVLRTLFINVHLIVSFDRSGFLAYVRFDDRGGFEEWTRL